MREEMAWKRNWSEETLKQYAHLTQFLAKALAWLKCMHILNIHNAVGFDVVYMEFQHNFNFIFLKL
jgi:hypothetical protein